MRYRITTLDNKEFETDCIGCTLARHEIEPLGGYIVDTPYFQVTQDTEIPITGFMILNSFKHIRGLADFSKEEQEAFSDLIFRVRIAMKEALGINQVTLVQEEKTENSHFHLWFFPWHDWMQKIGNGTDALRSIMEYARTNMKTSENLAKIEQDALKIKKFLKD